MLRTTTKLVLILFSTGILFSCLFYTSLVVDFTLVPRFLLLSFFVLLIWIYLAVSKNKIIDICIEPVSLPFIAFSLFTVLSVMWAANTALAIVESAKMLLFMLLMLTAYSLLVHYKERFLSVLLTTMLILCFIALLVALSQLTGLRGFSRSDLYLISGISGHKNLFSGFIYLCTVFSLLGFVHYRKPRRYYFLAAIVSQCLLIGILQARASWVGYLVFFVITIGLYFSRHRLNPINGRQLVGLMIAGMVALNVFFVALLPALLPAYNIREASSYNVEKVTDTATLAERVLIWQNSYDIFNENMFCGVGGNNWQVYFPKSSLPDIYAVTDLNVTYQRPHNDFLWMLTEYGLVGFNMYYSFVIMLICLLYYGFSRNANACNGILMAGLLGFMALSFFDFPRERMEHNMLLMLLFAVSMYQIKALSPRWSQQTWTLPYMVKRSVVLVLIAILYISALNFRGEYFLRKMYDSRIEGEHAQVIWLTKQAVSCCYNMDPTSVPLLWYSGNAHASVHNYDAALADFKEAYRAHPFNTHVINDLGSAFFLTHQVDSAKIFYKKAASINPRFDDPKLNLTAIYLKEDNYGEAERWNESLLHDSDRRELYREIIRKHKAK